MNNYNIGDKFVVHMPFAALNGAVVPKDITLELTNILDATTFEVRFYITPMYETITTIPANALGLYTNYIVPQTPAITFTRPRIKIEYGDLIFKENPLLDLYNKDYILHKSGAVPTIAPRCECGTDAVRGSKHSDWCPKK